MISGEKQDVVIDNELLENYVESDEDELDVLHDDDDEYEENDDLFANIDDEESDEAIFGDNDLADDNIENDFDINE